MTECEWNRIDGLKSGPIDHGVITSDWLQVVKPTIEERMQRYSSAETHFALLTIRPQRSMLLEQEIASIQQRLDHLTINQAPTDSASNPSSDGEYNELRYQLLTLQSQLENELHQQEKQRQENIRRRHNYIPFVMTLLRHLSRKNMLSDLIGKAKQKNEQTIGIKRKL